MLRWAFLFFIVALLATLFGFPVIAGIAADAARIICFLVIALLLLALVARALGGRPPPAS